MIKDFYKKFRIKDYMDNELKEKKIDYIDCSLGTNPFIEKRRVIEYIKKADFTPNEYVSNEYLLLKEALLDMYKTYVVDSVNKDNISFGSGTMGIIRNLSEFIIEKDSNVLGVSPQFTRFISEVELKQGKYDSYYLKEENNYKFVVDEFIYKMTPNIDLIYIDNPNNPTGQIIGIADIEKIVKKAEENGTIVLIDEAYGDYMDIKNSAITLTEKYDNVITIRSASKFYGLPNHRIGYLFASKEIIRIYNEISIPFPFSDLSASIFVNALKDYENISKTKEQVKEAKEYILKSIGSEKYLQTDNSTPIFTMKTDLDIDLTNKLIELGIITESGKNFVNLDERYSRMRINKEYRKIVERLKRIL